MSGVGFMILGATIIQWSAAIATGIFHSVSPSGASAWRILLGAVVLLIFARPAVRQWHRHEWLGALALGASVAFMNQCFYQALARIPLGAAVAIEYLGPFLVSALAKQTPRHLAMVALAGVGVLAITRPGGGISLWGAVFAAGSGLGWAAYVFSAHRVGAQAEGFGGLAVAMGISAVLTLPMSLGSASAVLGHPATLTRLFIVAIMAIVLGFAFELQALRRLKPATAGVLFALDPAMAFGIGFVLLHQRVSTFDVIGMVAVVVAGAGVTIDAASADAVVAQ